LAKADPKSLSDEELAQICASVAGEDALVAAGCLGGVIAASVLALSGLLGFWGLAWPAVGGFALTVVALILAHLVTRRPRRYRDELAYRSGRGPRSQYVAEAEGILRQHRADWVLLFSVRGLPHGDFRWLRLTLSEGPPASAFADLRVSPQPQRPVFKRVERDVPSDILQDLLHLLKELDLATLADVPSFVKDGAPCHLTVLRREPWLVRSASCNLAAHFMMSDRERAQFPAVLAASKLDKIICRLAPESWD